MYCFEGNENFIKINNYRRIGGNSYEEKKI